jgi:hypothetical protein
MLKRRFDEFVGQPSKKPDETSSGFVVLVDQEQTIKFYIWLYW